MKRSLVAVVVLILWTPSIANAGVVMEMVTKDAAGTETDRTKIYAQDERIRMEHSGPGGADATMIFLGDRFLYVDHSEETYMVMDEAMLEDVSSKINEAMKEMEAQLAAMPPEQRAMVEQMMKGQMQGMMQKEPRERPALRIESTGRGEWQSERCTEYDVFTGDQLSQQICAADLDEIDGGDEMIAAFRSMAAFIEKMTESMPMVSNDQPNPGELMEQIDGFPVHTIDYANGSKISESTVDSVAEEDLDDTLFSPPDGYRRQDPMSR